MARAFCVGTSGEVSLAASSAKTIIQLLAGANRGVAILRVKVSFEGVTAADEPARVQLLQQTTAGTMSAGTETCIAGPGASITPQATMQYNATVEPTGTTVFDEAYVHMQGGYEWVCQRGQDEILLTGATNRLGVKVTTETGTATTNCIATVWWEE
jgi:hypothetical protein